MAPTRVVHGRSSGHCLRLKHPHLDFRNLFAVDRNFLFELNLIANVRNVVAECLPRHGRIHLIPILECASLELQCRPFDAAPVLRPLRIPHLSSSSPPSISSRGFASWSAPFSGSPCAVSRPEPKLATLRLGFDLSVVHAEA